MVEDGLSYINLVPRSQSSAVGDLGTRLIIYCTNFRMGQIPLPPPPSLGDTLMVLLCKTQAVNWIPCTSVLNSCILTLHKLFVK